MQYLCLFVVDFSAVIPHVLLNCFQLYCLFMVGLSVSGSIL